MDAMNIRPQLLRTVAAWAALLAFMMLFQPDKLPVVALIVPFVMVYVAFYAFWRLFGLLRAGYFAHFAQNGANSAWKPHKKLGMALSGSLVLLLVLQSLGQLTARDVATVVAIIALGYLYLTRSRFTLAKQ